jgi:hypothetical protein
MVVIQGLDLVDGLLVVLALVEDLQEVEAAEEVVVVGSLLLFMKTVSY